MNKKYKIAIIGGGASGLAAAVAASERFGKGSVAVIEKQSRTGRKLLATGNGRCNLGNNRLSSRNYHGDKRIIDSVLSGFDTAQAKSFFSSLGLLIREDSEGRLYPYSNKASTVLDCLRYRTLKNGVEELCDFCISSISKENNSFVISSIHDTIYAENIILACGSGASPSLGADISGFGLLERFALKPTTLFPSLSPVPCKEKYKVLKGIRAKGAVTLYADNKKLAYRKGEIQFSDKGLSGICVFDLSRYVNEYFAVGTISSLPFNSISLSVDLMPETQANDIQIYLNKCRRLFGGESSELLLSFAFDKKLSGVLSAAAGISKNRSCSDLTDRELHNLAKVIKNFDFTPEKQGSLENSQVCAGGFDSRTVDPGTLMCRRIRKMYICGEMLDVDGDCGGYNLHFAFGSGIKAAQHIR